jgi:hypothetical protein
MFSGSGQPKSGGADLSYRQHGKLNAEVAQWCGAATDGTPVSGCHQRNRPSLVALLANHSNARMTWSAPLLAVPLLTMLFRVLGITLLMVLHPALDGATHS